MQSPSSSLSETEIAAVTKTEKPNQTIATHHADNPKNSEVTSVQTKKSEVSEASQSAETEDAELPAYFKRTARQIREQLESLNSLNPDQNFSKAAPFDFSKSDHGMFAALFEDRLHHVKVAIYLQFEKGSDEAVLSTNSCVEIAEDTKFTDQTLRIRDAGDGLILAMLGEKYFMRMGIESNPKRVLVGKLYEKTTTGWRLARDFDAPEIPVHGLPDKCVFQ